MKKSLPTRRCLLAALLVGIPAAVFAADGPLLWFSGNRLTATASVVLDEMSRAETRGLRAADYNADGLRAAAAAGHDLAGVDGRISATARRFLMHLRLGRVQPRAAGYDLDLPAESFDTEAGLRRLALSADPVHELDAAEPRFRHYPLLKRALAIYRELARNPALTALPALPGRSVKPGGSYDGAPALRTLLIAVGDLAAGSPPPEDQTLLDETTVEALQRFQTRHGLQADGVLGASTFRELTRPMSQRLQQIELSMERARWLPQPGDGPFVMVNIPQFRLFAFRGPEDDEKLMTAMNVIVGRSFPTHNTPAFVAEMRYIVVRPYWDVPRSITLKEELPRLRADPDLASREGFELVRGQTDRSPVVPLSAENLDALARGELRLRQRPGPRNALGAIKFMLPNHHNVYLHSTPAQSLFAQTRRAYSHGCVRLADPLALAGVVLGAGSQWTAGRLQDEMEAAGEPLRIDLERPVRVMIIYATAIAAEDYRVLFFEDIYGHDTKLSRLLAGTRQ